MHIVTRDVIQIYISAYYCLTRCRLPVVFLPATWVVWHLNISVLPSKTARVSHRVNILPSSDLVSAANTFCSWGHLLGAILMGGSTSPLVDAEGKGWWFLVRKRPAFTILGERGWRQPAVWPRIWVTPALISRERKPWQKHTWCRGKTNVFSTSRIYWPNDTSSSRSDIKKYSSCMWSAIP